MNKLLVAAAASLAMLSGAAMAQGYVGAGIGQVRISDDCSGTTSCSLTSTGGKVFGGYLFDNGLAVEAHYFDFGKASATAGAASADLKGSGVGLGMAYFGKFAPDWRGVARLGAASMKADISGSLGGGAASTSETKTKVYGGLGLGYMVSRNVSIDLGLDVSAISFQGASDNVRLFSVGVTFGF